MSEEPAKSPMIGTKITCNGYNNTVEKLSTMGIDRRWSEDNRIPTWTFGLVNMAYDFNFIPNANIVCDTDDRVQQIVADVEGEEGVGRQIIGARNIRFNGQGLQIMIGEQSSSSSESN